MRVLFAGASGFGNLGDDAYRIAFRERLSDQHALRFDSPYPDLEAVRWCDALVIGGGGLIYCNDTPHFEYMEAYLAEAERLGKPWFFSSVGVQLVGRSLTEEAALEAASQIEPWAPWIERAVSITVRSHLDVKLIKRVAPGVSVAAYPDACYVLRAERVHPQLVRDGAYLAMPTKTSCRDHFEDYRALYEAAREESRGFYIVCMSEDDRQTCLDLGESLGVRGGHRRYGARDLIEGVLPYAARVVSGRYHGHVLARAAGVRDVKCVDDRIKSRFEPTWEQLGDAGVHAGVLNHELNKMEWA